MIYIFCTSIIFHGNCQAAGVLIPVGKPSDRSGTGQEQNTGKAAWKGISCMTGH